MYVMFILAAACVEKAACGEGWDEEQFVQEAAEAMCTQIERCDGSDYGIYEGPDHAGCVSNAQAYIQEHDIAPQEAPECGSFDGCAADRKIEELWEYIDDCQGEDGFTWEGSQLYDPGCPDEPIE